MDMTEWQDRMHPEVVSFLLCAVCAQQSWSKEIEEVDLRTVNLTPLRNNTLPPQVLLTTYDVAEFYGAILYPKALRDLYHRTFGDVCQTCLKSLHAGTQPENSLVNFQYCAYNELPENISAAF